MAGNTDNITLALSKGRIFDETLPLLKAVGIEPVDDPEQSRKLVIATNRADLKIIIVRASDVPTYVQYGAADMGIAGKDVQRVEQAAKGVVATLQIADRVNGHAPDSGQVLVQDARYRERERRDRRLETEPVVGLHAIEALHGAYRRFQHRTG